MSSMRNALYKAILFSILTVYSTDALHAQGARYELGGGVVGSFYDKKTLSGTGGNVDAGFEPGYGASLWLGHYMYTKVSGEIRYDYLRNDMKLEGAGNKTTFGAESHALHYDIHIHLSNTQARIRPYIIGGGGVKVFRGTGEERAFQPLSQFAVLTKTSEMTALVTVGVGIKMNLADRVLLRLEFRDNLTPFPKKLITPNRATGGSGWINNFAPSAGVSVLF